MIPGEFDYYSPGTLAEALSLLRQHGSDAKLLAGGQSLIPAMRFRLSMPPILIDLNGIEGLEYVREDNGHLAIGAMTREVALEESSLVQSRFPILADAARVIADPVVRNRATVGGNIAEVIALGPKGTRVIPIDKFFVDLFENALSDDEILTEIRIPTPGANSGGAYVKMERKVGDYAISAVAVQLTMNGNTCTSARIGLTNVSPAPMRAKNAEQVLVGQALTDEVIEAAGIAAATECDPSPDLRGSAEYKRDITRVLTKRAIRQAMARASSQ
jgi:carbon-monoxide dehydrogenase medium subunit